MKELRFHPQYRSLLLTTAEDSFNIFRPNLDPDFVGDDPSALEKIAEDEYGEEEAKGSDSTKPDEASMPRIAHEQESDEDMEHEEARMRATKKELGKRRRNRSKSKGRK